MCPPLYEKHQYSCCNKYTYSSAAIRHKIQRSKYNTTPLHLHRAYEQDYQNTARYKPGALLTAHPSLSVLGCSPQVTYALGNYENYFSIDPYTGNITTLITFDREVEYSYTVKVIATDNSPSALFKTGEHNKGEQNFRIEIADKNDNPPHFTQREYKANSIPEDANINALVTEVKALDADTASPVTYSILLGNVDESFYIENTTGKIRVNQPLDYEKITQYNLTVRAFDGVFDDTATVRIYVENVNDNQPVFEAFNKNPVIEEEKLYDGKSSSSLSTWCASEAHLGNFCLLVA